VPDIVGGQIRGVSAQSTLAHAWKQPESSGFAKRRPAKGIQARIGDRRPLGATVRIATMV
jgi:hypothetical protein